MYVVALLWVFGLAALYIVILLIVAWASLHPYRIPFFFSPGGAGVPQEDVAFESDGITLRGWWLPAEVAGPVMVCFHGYMMNRCELAAHAMVLRQIGVSSLLVDFRAHGKSGGRVCTLGYDERRDVSAAVRYARERRPGAKIGLYGSSMGSAAAAFALGENPKLADLLILDSAYGRLSEAVQGWWRFIGGKWLAFLLAPTAFLSWRLAGFNPYKINVADSLRKVSIPTLVIHGSRDALASPKRAQENFDALAGPKKLVWLNGYTHSEGRWEQPAFYNQTVLEFLREHDFVAEIAGKEVPAVLLTD